MILFVPLLRMDRRDMQMLPSACFLCIVFRMIDVCRASGIAARATEMEITVDDVALAPPQSLRFPGQEILCGALSPFFGLYVPGWNEIGVVFQLQFGLGVSGNN